MTLAAFMIEEPFKDMKGIPGEFILAWHHLLYILRTIMKVGGPTLAQRRPPRTA